MKVLVISEHYFPIVGGSTTYVYNLCKNLASFNCEVYLVTLPDDENPVLDWYKDNNFNVYRLRIPKSLRKERYFPFFLWKRLKSIIKDVDPDIIHFGHGFFAPLVTKLDRMEKPIVWTIQNVPPYEHSLDRGGKSLGSVLEKLYFSVAEIYGRFVLRVYDYDRLICVSDKTAGLVRERGISLEDIVVIPNGVDIDFFAPSGNLDVITSLGLQKYAPIVLIMAGIIPHKGLKYLVNAVPQVVEKYPEVLFLIIGPIRSEAYHQKLESLIVELDLSDNIQIIPGVDILELRKYYAACNIYVQPSLEEGFCISILEAMSCGKPVIGTKTGAIPKFIEESKGGILIDSASSEQIYTAIMSLLTNPRKMEKMGLRSRDYVLTNFSWNKTAEKTLELYNKLNTRKV